MLFFFASANLNESISCPSPSPTTIKSVPPPPSLRLLRLHILTNQTPNLVHYSTYSIPELLPAAQIMLDYILDPDFNADTVFHKKYASKKHMKSSIYVRHWALKNWPESANGTVERGRELWDDYEDTYLGLSR